MKLGKKLGMALIPLALAAAGCSSNAPRSEAAMKKDAQDASKQVENATAVVQKMEADPKMKDLMQTARGIFIIPRYGQAALGIGGSGGEGILLVKHGSTWGDPAFYNVGGISIGLQAGAEGGAMAFVLNNDRAVQQFQKSNNVQLNANAGITVVNWSKSAQADLSKADVIAWSDSKGLFGGAAIGLQDAVYDQADTSGFYGRQVALADFFSGQMKAPAGKTTALKRVLTRGPSSRLSGGSGGSGTSGSSSETKQ
jgi:lipid-binding SYLF domain-containing protein